MIKLDFYVFFIFIQLNKKNASIIIGEMVYQQHVCNIGIGKY